MAIDVKPETERMVNEEIQCGHFRSADELIVESVSAWREKHRVTAGGGRRKPRQNLADFLLESPFHGSELTIERQTDYPREIDLV
jgi:Arc/MetJ-type ribon-helix-helix transcriptional regulator